jgi:hypothetical protein
MKHRRLYSLVDNEGQRVFPHAAYVLDIASRMFQTFLLIGTYYYEPDRVNVTYKLKVVGHEWRGGRECMR